MRDLSPPQSRRVVGLGASISENWPQRGQFLPDLQTHSPAMGQKDGEKWTAAVDLQPTISKSDRLLGSLPVLCGTDIERQEALLDFLDTVVGNRFFYSHRLAPKTS